MLGGNGGGSCCGYWRTGEGGEGGKCTCSLLSDSSCSLLPRANEAVRPLEEQTRAAEPRRVRLDRLSEEAVPARVEGAVYGWREVIVGSEPTLSWRRRASDSGRIGAAGRHRLPQSKAASGRA